jgi:hypothetical protein
MFALRVDFVGASRDEVAPPAGRTDISMKTFFMAVKYPA